jgi:hypothetical protein
MALELSPWLIVSILAVIGTVVYVLNKQRVSRLAPLMLLTEDAFASASEPFMNAPTTGPVGVESTIRNAAGEVTEFPAPDAETTYPTPRNPFMNVLPTDYPRNVYSKVHEKSEEYNPDRPAAAPADDPVVNAQLDDYFRTNFYNDPTDVFGKNQSQRQFIVMPSTTIPNDRESYQNWLYKMYPEPCKAGGREACLPGTDGGPIVSLNQYY